MVILYFFDVMPCPEKMTGVEGEVVDIPPEIYFWFNKLAV